MTCRYSDLIGKELSSACPGCGHGAVVHVRGSGPDDAVCAICAAIKDMRDQLAGLTPSRVEVVTPDAGGYLTDDELAVLDHLTAFINGFRALPQFHFADVPEAVQHVHALQNMVMARAAQRAHPNEFPVEL